MFALTQKGTWCYTFLHKRKFLKDKRTSHVLSSQAKKGTAIFEALQQESEETMEEKIILKAEKVGKEFNRVQVLSDIDFDLRAGEIHALIGENGAGKSTFVKIISGVYQASFGKYYVDGVESNFKSSKESEDAGLYTIHQEINLVPYFNAYQNIFIGNEKNGSLGLLDEKGMAQKAREVLAQLNIDLDIHKPVKHFNTALQRIIQISAALVYKPKILIFDEPTTALGEEERDKLLEIIRDLKKSGVGIIFISHNIEEIVAISDRVTVFKDGQKMGTLEGSEIEGHKIVSMMIGGQEYETFSRGSCIDYSCEVLRLDNLCNSKLKDVSMTLHKGEILGVAGVVGAGKSETARAIFGIDEFKSGKITVAGQPYEPRPTTAVKRKLALVPEERRVQGLIGDFSVAENIVMVYLDKFTKRFFLQRKKESAVAKEHIGALSIKTTGPRQIVRYLSGGNQQKVVLSKWLCGDFDVLILDEPTKGIDVMAKRDIYKLISDIAEQGKSVLFFSSYLPELLDFCDRILVMSDGEVVGEYPSSGPDAKEVITHAMLGGKTK